MSAWWPLVWRRADHDNYSRTPVPGGWLVQAVAKDVLGFYLPAGSPVFVADPTAPHVVAPAAEGLPEGCRHYHVPKRTNPHHGYGGGQDHIRWWVDVYPCGGIETTGRPPAAAITACARDAQRRGFAPVEVPRG